MKVPKEYRIICKCEKCNKPFSYDKRKGYSFGKLCRECANKTERKVD